MTRRTDQLNRIEASLARLEESLSGHATHLRDQADATRIEVRDARASAESAHAGVQALADMLAVTVPPEPAAGGVTPGDTVTAARRAPKSLKPKGMLDGRGGRLTGGTS